METVHNAIKVDHTADTTTEVQMERAKQALDQPAQEAARLRGDLEAAEARNKGLSEEIIKKILLLY